MFGVFVEVCPHLLGLRSDLQVDAIEQKLEISYVFFIIFEDLAIADHCLDHLLIDIALEQRVDVSILQ